MKIPSVRRTVQIFSDFSGGVSGQREENLLPQRYARAGFNFASGDGALRGDPGVSALSAGIEAPAPSPEERTIEKPSPPV